MKPALYNDYVEDLQGLLDAVDRTPDSFRSFDLHIELAHKGLLFVYETRRRQGQTDSLYYARMASTGESKQVSQKTAYDAVSGFFRIGGFAALTGEPVRHATDDSPAFDAEYPSCAVTFTYRRTGMEKTASMKMIFLALGDKADAVMEEAADRLAVVMQRPLRSERLWEWK